MPSFSFVGYTLTELFRKPDNWQQIYKQTSSSFYTSNYVFRRNYFYVIARLWNSCLMTLKKAKNRSSHLRCKSSHRRCSIKKVFLKNFENFTGKHLCWFFFNKVAGLQSATFLKRNSNVNAFLWSLQNF